MVIESTDRRTRRVAARGSRAFLFVAVLLVAQLVAADAALASVSGSATFECTAHLDSWPTSGSFGTCDGLATVTVSGVDDTGTPYTVDGAGALASSFNHRAPCIAAVPPLTGSAQGTVTIAGLTAVRGNRVTMATLTTNFTWARVGLGAVVVLSGTRVDFAEGASATGSLGSGNATFVPIPTVENMCPEGGPMTAFVSGTVVFPL